MRYEDLNINQKINTKAALAAWAKYSVEHFQAELDKKVYGLRTSQKQRIQRSSLGNSYRFGSRKGRTNNLRRTWWQMATGERVVINFLLYGRFLDMGVGRGTTHTDRLTARQLGLGRVGRTRRNWYSKRKGYEIKRLNEILAQQNIHLLVDSLENALTLSVNLTI